MATTIPRLILLFFLIQVTNNFVFAAENINETNQIIDSGTSDFENANEAYPLFINKRNDSEVVRVNGISFIKDEILVLFPSLVLRNRIDEIVESVNGELVGFNPILNLATIKVPVNSVDELESLIQSIITEPEHFSVMKNFVEQLR